jgi:muramoyltetrapeptide carboxypeptidase
MNPIEPFLHSNSGERSNCSRPPYLSPGDKIGLIAAARKVSLEEMKAAKAVFDTWRLVTVEGNFLYGSDRQFGGTDAQRASDLQQMLDDRDIRAIVVARGGYGTVRIIDRIDFSGFSSSPKWIVGYSDITVLHSHINGNLGIETLHAAMPINFTGDGTVSVGVESLRQALFGELQGHAADSHPLNRPGEGRGILAGGNLSVLYSLQGSVSDIDTRGKILFLEDLDEYLYHVDRMMMSLKRSGKLRDIAGLVVGGMTEMHDNAVPFGFTAEEIIREAVDEYDFPVCFGFPAGHIPNNYALYLGREVALSVGKQVEFSFI